MFLECDDVVWSYDFVDGYVVMFVWYGIDEFFVEDYSIDGWVCFY